MKKVLLVIVCFSLCSVLVVTARERPHKLEILAEIPYTTADVGGDKISPKALDGLNDIRKRMKKRYRITSGYRSPKHNATVGGVSNSQHTKGQAFDVWVPHSEREEFYEAAKAAGFSAYGWGNNTVHIDMGTRRWWTYDNAGNHLSGESKWKHLHKAPDNFKRDFRL